MVTIFGWMEIRATYFDEDKHPEIDENKIYSEIEKRINELKYNEVKMFERNYTRFIQFSMFENHRTERTDEIINIFCDIARIATGSYGMLYCLDDEDKVYYDEFRVLISKKGRTEWKKDEYFSPCSKMIEDIN